MIFLSLLRQSILRLRFSTDAEMGSIAIFRNTLIAYDHSLRAALYRSEFMLNHVNHLYALSVPRPQC